jgi:hypothetical protein
MHCRLYEYCLVRIQFTFSSSAIVSLPPEPDFLAHVLQIQPGPSHLGISLLLLELLKMIDIGILRSVILSSSFGDHMVFFGV